MSGTAIRRVESPGQPESPQSGPVLPDLGGSIVDLAKVRRQRSADPDRHASPRTAVRLYRLDRRPKQHGAAQPWVLEFEPTAPTRTDPLMGWVGWSDPHQQVRLLFSTRARAVAFAERQGWAYDLSEPPTQRASLMDEIRHAVARPVSFAGLGDWRAVM